MTEQAHSLRMKSGPWTSRVIAGMSYLGILVLVPLAFSRMDSFIRFHARQGMVLWIWEVAAIWILIIPGLGRPIFHFSSIVCLVFSLAGLLSVYLGRAWKFPVIGRWAERL
ncbi:MAG: hypothetical protein HQL82_00090 [Magnetococcales bacterium]|nr:hypothetical protein [Magnetococcales bacterium]